MYGEAIQGTSEDFLLSKYEKNQKKHEPKKSRNFTRISKNIRRHANYRCMAKKKTKLKPLSEVSMPKSKKIQFFRDTQISDKFSLICESFGF